MIKNRAYSEWADTAQTIHMTVQMMGKVKLAVMPSQPEWNHTLLQPTPSGYTTGLIPHGDTSFEILLDIEASRVVARCTTGRAADYPLGGERSISEYYGHFLDMLAYIGHSVKISKTPQEVVNTTPFDRQTEPLAYDASAARDYFDVSIFAHNALLSFASAYRGKKIMPSLFWGTFDNTTVLFSGAERPFAGEGIIEKVAFDEQMIEFGFWPGDPKVDEPSFFVLPYPFLEKDLSGSHVTPAEAYYSHEKKEFFLPLKDVLRHENPSQVVTKFCHDTFDVITKAEGWENVDWFVKPLDC